MLSTNVLLHGREEPPPQKITLRAGPLSMLFEPETAFVRSIRFGDCEVLRGVYAAVRDEFWNTVPPRVQNLNVAQSEDEFRLAFEVECVEGPVDFDWQGTLAGTSDGTVTYAMHGTARSTFRRNRIGFCVLHPAECAGCPCVVNKVDGSTEQGRFPDAISPHQPFFDVQSIAHEFADARWAEVLFEGDVFEMEDQRNWTDASFKTYCTPLARPRPVEIKAGTSVTQTVTLRLRGETKPPGQVARRSPAAIIQSKDSAPARLPRIGLGLASHGRSLSEREAELLRASRLDHLRVDLNLSDDQFPSTLERAAAEARTLDTVLEIALFLGASPDVELQRLVDALRATQPAVARWLLFQSDHSGVSDPLLDIARQRLTPYAADAFFGTGTNIYFTELNRERPSATSADFVCYSVNPQVHAFDDDSLIETLAGQTATASSARRFYPRHALVISPITLRPAFNPNGAKQTGAGELPPEVDPRQMSLFAAAWTLASIRRLAAEGAESLTYYETTGWRGVIETDDGTPSHEQFRSFPGAVFPVYHVFADLAELRDRPVDFCRWTQPLRVEGLTFAGSGPAVTLLANLTPEPQRISLSQAGHVSSVRVRMLDAATATAAMHDPRAFRSQPGEVLASPEVDLPPYAVVRIEHLR